MENRLRAVEAPLGFQWPEYQWWGASAPAPGDLTTMACYISPDVVISYSNRPGIRPGDYLVAFHAVLRSNRQTEAKRPKIIRTETWSFPMSCLDDADDLASIRAGVLSRALMGGEADG